MCQFLIPLISISVLASGAHAEIPSQTKENLQKDAQLIVVGKVSSASVSVDGDANFTNWIAEFVVDVTSVEKGKLSGYSDALNVRCYRWKERPRGFVGPSGHYDIPAESARVRLWLKSMGNGTWQPLLPNGIEIVSGQPLDLEQAELAKKKPQPKEIYAATKGNKRLVLRGMNWSCKNEDGSAGQLQENGRDLSWIYVSNVESNQLLRIPRLEGIVQAWDANSKRFKDLFKVRRTYPAVTDRDFEAFQVTVDKVGPDESEVVPVGPLVAICRSEPAFLRVGDTWEQLDLGSNELVARYKEQYRDSQRIQLQLIVEHAWQKPHTLTILRHRNGATIVLPVADAFEKFQLECVASRCLDASGESASNLSIR